MDVSQCIYQTDIWAGDTEPKGGRPYIITDLAACFRG